MSSNATIQTTALHEILKWSANRPEWQRDALRRILENRNLAEKDLQELERICRSSHQVDTNKSPPISSIPLVQSHLPPAPGVAESVSLVSVGDLKNVNRLPSGQTMPLGAELGLTVVYGENGAGKSGYARVIKKACRARGLQPTIRPNVFASVPTTKTSANIVFRVGGVDVSVTWTDGVSADARLANVYVFDASAAGHYVCEESAAAFTPYGLDILPTLSKACDTIDEKIKTDISYKRTIINSTAVNWKYNPDTRVGRLVKNLTASTKPSDIESNSGLDDKQAQRLKDLREAFKSDPLQKAKTTRASASRLAVFSQKIASFAISFSDASLSSIKKIVEDERNAANLAREFTKGQFDASYIAGTGGDLWRALWESAREYSNSLVYPEQVFPVTDDARCVLCQQDIDSDSASRLTAFEKFAKDTSQQLAIKADKLVIAEKNKFDSMSHLLADLEKVESDLLLFSDEQRLLISDFVSKADALLDIVKGNLSTRNWVATPILPPSPEATIVEWELSLESRAKMEESASDPETLKALIAEGHELADRDWLAGVKSAVLTQIEAYKEVAKLELCRKDVNTAQITAKSSDLTRQFVTDAFQQCFKDELKLLGLKTLDVGLEPAKGKKGETKFGLRLVSANTQKVVDIASEGEQRCIALAAFMSELSQASHKSALVFDDPVSSLDHWHREKIASRLVSESQQRQVVVFTHDVVFLNDLLAYSEKLAMMPSVLTLEWNNGAPGQYVKGLPWDSRKPNACLEELLQDQKAISAKWNPQPNSENKQSMRRAYSRLRSTLERIIEHELLGGVVRRFDSQVHSGNVSSLIGITSAECDVVKRLIKKCHQITDAHAPSTNPIPDPIEFMKDINDSKQLVVDIKSRKAATSP